jgi:chloramphenicol-sensitive protein RarD
VHDEPAAPARSPRGLLAERGLPAGIGAYLLWGVLPLYFPLLAPAGAVEIIAHRIVWSLVFCALLLTVTRGWRQVRALAARPRTLVLLGLAAALLAVNWLVYVYAVLAGHVVDAALGYFVNPLVTVGLAVLVLHERLRATQWAALGLGAAAVVVITAGYGRLPWIALVLACSFGVYGLIKSRLGGHVPALAGLATETALLTPVAGGYLLWLTTTGGSSFAAYGGWHAAAMASAGVVTAVPLLLFNSAARRLPLSVVGMLQYMTPVMQFGLGVLVFHEHMPPARWVGFALVWTALVVLAVDGTRHRRTQVLEARAAEEAAGA